MLLLPFKASSNYCVLNFLYKNYQNPLLKVLITFAGLLDYECKVFIAITMVSNSSQSYFFGI